MKKILFGIAAMSMLFGTSCQNEEIVSRAEGQEFSLTLDMGINSRTMMGENGAVWGDDESIYVVGNNGRTYGELKLVWKSTDGKKAMFSGKVTGDASDLEHMVYPVPKNGQIPMETLNGLHYNAPMTGSIKDGEAMNIQYAGGLVMLNFSEAAKGETFTVKATDNSTDKTEIVGGYYTFDSETGKLNYIEVEGNTLEINNVPKDGIVWLPVASDAPKGSSEKITVSVTDKFGTTISGDVNIGQGGAAAEDGNVFPSMTYNKDTGLAPTESESVDGANVLEEAFTNGGQYQLTQDITLTEALSLPEDKSLYLDLNGKTITLDGENAEEVVEIRNYGTLNIFNGKIVAANYENSRRCIYNYGTMTIGMEGGSHPVEFVQQYNMKGAAINNEGNMTIKNATVNAVYFSIWNSGEKAEIVVNSGKYTTENDVNVRDTWAYAVNNINGAKMTINGGTFTGNHGVVASTKGAEATLNGGTFNCTTTYTGNSDWTLYTETDGVIKYDYDCVMTHGYYTDNRYKTTYESEGSYIYVIAGSGKEMQDVLDAGNNVLLDNPISVDALGSNSYGKTGFNQLYGGIIDGANNTLGVEGADATWDSAINTTGGTIKNLTITKGFRGIFINHNSEHAEKVILKNVIVDGTTYTISCDQGTGNGLDAEDCIFKGWTSYAATLGEAKFTNCYFGEGSGYSYSRPFAQTIFENCEFESGHTLDPRANCTFINCKLDGILLTTENISELVTKTDKVSVENN